MTVKELRKFLKDKKSNDEVSIYQGPSIGFSYCDEDDFKIGDLEVGDGVHPWLRPGGIS